MSETSPAYAFQYREVANLADTFLPMNRRTQARGVDQLLVERDKKIARLELALSGRDAGIQRYQEENAELRGYIGRVRSVLADLWELCRYSSIAKIGEPAVASIRLALDFPIPGPGATKQRPEARTFRARIQTCASCPTRQLCAIRLAGSAPCGENKWLHVEEHT